jgi:hypothetical protein
MISFAHEAIEQHCPVCLASGVSFWHKYNLVAHGFTDKPANQNCDAN